MKKQVRSVDLDRLSSWAQRSGKVCFRQPNSCVIAPLRSEGGQIVVEYVLLLVVAIMAATIIARAMISTDTADPGFVLSTWSKVIQAIGADHADDIERAQ